MTRPHELSWLDPAPQVIIYDNNCKLHCYAVNREPAFFRNTAWFIDRLHRYAWAEGRTQICDPDISRKGRCSWNHTGCSEGYTMDKFQALSNVNSMVAEQENSILKAIRYWKEELNETVLRSLNSYLCVFGIWQCTMWLHAHS